MIKRPNCGQSAAAAVTSKYAAVSIVSIIVVFIVIIMPLVALTSCISILPGGGAGAGAGNGDEPLETSAWGYPVPYGDDTVVVVNTAADIYETADKTSRRITQLLFNQPVQVIAQNDLWAKVNVDEKNAGWVRARDIDSDWNCVDPRRYKGRIVITAREKQVYSHPRNGMVIRDVGMGTELFFYTRSDNVYEVALPGNVIGWISESGTFQLEVDEPIKKTGADVFIQSCDKFKGTSYLIGGASSLGIDSAGIIFVTMKINGVLMPRDFNNQFALGEEVRIRNLENIQEAELQIGDILFFGANRASSGGDNSGGNGNSSGGTDLYLDDAGIYMGEGNFLHASQHTGKVQLNNISDDYYRQRLKGVRRYF